VSDEAREAPRVAAEFRVTYQTVDELVVAYCTDLSKGGLFLAADAPLPPDTIVSVLLELPEGSAAIPTTARVVYRRDAEQAKLQGKPMGMGLTFLDLDEDTLMLIEAFISERITTETAQMLPVRMERRLSVLVVDDDVACQKVAAAPFRARGDYVRVAGDGMEALALALKEAPDVVLADVNMPRMDGWVFLRMMRARPQLSTVPFIFLTTLSGEEERLRGYQLGVDDYVSKPYRSTELRARVDRLTARMRPVRDGEASLRGDLEQVSLGSVLTFLEFERKTGELTVESELVARVLMREGRPLKVEIEGAPPMSPLELFHTLLDWPTGRFQFAGRELDLEDDLKTTSTAILLEHARLKDESS
jgi:uncharacterized protein (TIGR02266 family)